MKTTSKRFAEMWCELNCWKLPKELGPEPLLKDALGGAMRVCEAMTTPKEINDAWEAMNQKPKRVSRRGANGRKA